MCGPLIQSFIIVGRSPLAGGRESCRPVRTGPHSTIMTILQKYYCLVLAITDGRKMLLKRYKVFIAY